jgi:hypothetical protein
MTRFRQLLMRRPAFYLGMALAAAALCALSGRLAAQNGNGTPSLVRVEEDWSLSVNQPDESLGAPQVSTQMARAPWAGHFCNLHLNSTDLPTFAVGGVQLQAWNGSTNVNVLTSPNSATLATSNELITWTQYLRVDSTTLYFGIGTAQPGVAGASSQTWGDFSGMEITVPESRPRLDSYDPSYSVNNSGVTFGSNRVDSFTLVQVRYYYSDGSVVTDSTPRVVYSTQLTGDN